MIFVRKNYLTLGFLLFLFPTLWAQNFAPKKHYLVDSLNLDLVSDQDKIIVERCLKGYHAASNDTIKIEALCGIVVECWDSRVWVKYNDFILDFCEAKLKNQLGEKQAKYYNETWAFSIGNKGYYHKGRGELDLAYTYYKQFLDGSIKQNDKVGSASALCSLGDIHGVKGDYAQALSLMEKALKINEEIKDEEGIALCLNSMGVILNSQGNIVKSLEYYHRSLKIQEKLKNEEAIAVGLNNIGFVNESLGNYELSLSYYYKCLNLQEKIQNKEGIAMSLNNIGYIKAILKSYPEALDYYQKSLKLYKKIGNKNGEATSLVNIGKLYEQEGKLNEALNLYRESIILKTEVGDQSGMLEVKLNIAQLYFSRNDLVNAEILGLDVKNGAKKIGKPKLIRGSAELLYKIYLQKKLWKKALVNHELFISMRDSLLNEENTKAAMQAKFTYEYRKKTDADSIVQAEKMKLIDAKMSANRAEAEVQKQQKLYLAIGLGLLALFGAITYRKFRESQKQKNIINAQKILVEETHQEINDSIKYAQRLQLAILAPPEELKLHIGEVFVYFKPKDIVSGDFYWVDHKDGVSYIAAADCTGHGVPGAMVSVVCSNALNRSLKEFDKTDPKDILDKSRDLVIETFARSGENVKDGMDIALCAMNGKKLTYAGANNPLWIIRKKENLTSEELANKGTVFSEDMALIEFKGSKQPVGYFEVMKEFEQTEIDLFEGDTFYLFTDGFADQFGGEKGKKFKYKPFKEYLLDINKHDMELQKEGIARTFNEWRGSLDQVDDVCVIGVRV